MSDESSNSNIISQFIEDFGFYTLAEFIPAALGLVSLVIYTRIFSTVAYGQY